MIYGDSLTESTGKQHNYLGMIFDFSSKNEVQINMNLYISKIIKEFPEEIIGKTSTPAGDHLFKIREDGCKLDDEMQTAFLAILKTVRDLPWSVLLRGYKGNYL